MAGAISFGDFYGSFECTYCRVDGGDTDRAIGKAVVFVIKEADCYSYIAFCDSVRV